MKIYPDDKLIKKISNSTLEERHSIINTCWNAFCHEDGSHLQFLLGWPALLEYLDFEPVFENFPKLNKQNKIFSAVIEVLKMDSDKEVVVYLYDQIFVECLREVKMLKQVDPKVLLDQIRFKHDYSLFQGYEDPFSRTITYYERRLIQEPQNIIHDLILYLAWDRACIYLAALFNEISLQLKNGLEILRECLIESFQHITENGKTIPSLFRFVESLYAYMMKEENFQKYTESEWEILCKSPIALPSTDDLPHASYIDAGLSYGKQLDPFILKFLTFEDAEIIKARLTISEFTLSRLQKEIQGWQYVLRPCEIACLKEENNRLIVDSIINSQDHLSS
jgi:hypothetical protein